MICFKSIRRIVALNCLLFGVSILAFGSSGPTPQLEKQWIGANRATVITGIYRDKCSAFSFPTTGYTGLLSLVLPRAEFQKHHFDTAIDKIDIVQLKDRLQVVAYDGAGAIIVSTTLNAGRDYQANDSEVIFTERWNGGDEWGTSKGITFNHISRAANGQLLLKSVSEVTRSLFWIPSKRVTTMYFVYDEAAVEENGGSGPNRVAGSD